ncbi:UNVERIFIED_CONTAM: hypothetical protein NCL1_25737 [Trichonephila clavipes]
MNSYFEMPNQLMRTSPPVA